MEAAECLAASERVQSNRAFVARMYEQMGEDKWAADKQNPETATREELLGVWRQLDNVWEVEPCFELLIDHPSVIEKVRALFGDRFILHSSWNTMAPAGFKVPDDGVKAEFGGFHQD